MENTTRNVAILMIVLCAFAIMVVTGERDDVFTPKRLKVIDSIQYGEQPDRFNILFRSNRPTNGVPSVFYYDDLLSAMIEAAKTREIHISPSHQTYMIIFSLLAENDMTNYLEITYFQQHPEKGEMRNYPILGTYLNPEDFSEQQIINKTATLNMWLPDPLDFVVQEIRSALYNFTNPDVNLLILFHCTHGCVFLLVYYVLVSPLFTSSLKNDSDNIYYYYYSIIIF